MNREDLHKETAGKAVCPVCPRHCALGRGETGFCRARKEAGGQVVCDNYGSIASLALDPIEKKPFARFHPGEYVLSVGSYGCNMRCPFCQNYEISQIDKTEAAGRYMAPEKLVETADSLRERGNIGLAFTYNEPAVGYEFARDCSLLAKERGLTSVMVTNGYICREPLAELLKGIDAFNIDLKCFTAKGYKSLSGELEPVRKAIRRAAEKAHVEITTLVVPGLSDGEEDMDKEARWLAAVSPDIPLHISRYFPRWQAVEGATPLEKMEELARIARGHLKYVYLGNC